MSLLCVVIWQWNNNIAPFIVPNQHWVTTSYQTFIKLIFGKQFTLKLIRSINNTLVTAVGALLNNLLIAFLSLYGERCANGSEKVIVTGKFLTNKLLQINHSCITYTATAPLLPSESLNCEVSNSHCHKEHARERCSTFAKIIKPEEWKCHFTSLPYKKAHIHFIFYRCLC